MVRTSKDTDNIIRVLLDIGCNGKMFEECKRMIFANEKDTGFTYTNKIVRTSVMIVMQGSNTSEFFNTLIHEQKHVERNIERAYNIDPYGEEAAYLSGSIAQHVFLATRQYICKDCKNYIKSV